MLENRHFVLFSSDTYCKKIMRAVAYGVKKILSAVDNGVKNF
jgi:hypothetical protein